MATIAFPSLPRVGPLLARAIATSARRPGGRAALPDTVLRVSSHTQDIAALARYDAVCGFSLRDRVPPTWLHVLTFPLHLALMAEPSFPYPLGGMVHASNDMTLHRPVTIGERLELSVRAENARAHRKGVVYDMVGEVRVADELAWHGVSRYLVVGGTPPDAAGAREASTAAPSPYGVADLPAAQEWRLAADLGRRYAAASGDHNPIHLHPLTARPFGFKRPIVHGMWTHARALAALEPRLPEAYTVSVKFTKPIPLPSRVGFAAAASGDGTEFAVTGRHGVTHLVGRVA